MNSCFLSSLSLDFKAVMSTFLSQNMPSSSYIQLMNDQTYSAIPLNLFGINQHLRQFFMHQDIRYIENPFKKIVSIIKPDHNKLYTMLFNLIQEFIEGSKLPTLVAIASDPKQNQIDISAYAGVNGYLYTLIRLYKFFSSERLQEKETEEIIRSSVIAEDTITSKLKNPNFYLQLARQQYELIKTHLTEKKMKKSTLSFLMSETCTWVCGMHLGFIMRDNGLFRDNERRLVQCYNFYLKYRDKFMGELLYGTPGFLYAFLQCQQQYDGLEQELFRTSFFPISQELTKDIINIGIANYETIYKTKLDLGKGLPENFRLMYDFHKKEYLGGAHGLGGNLNLLLLSFKMNDFGKDIEIFYKLISSSILFLLKHFINGNFATSAGSQRIKLVHFCHGAPGIVSCLARFMAMFPEEGIKLGLNIVIKKALDHIWDYGVLKKGFGLCHGISGNAYAFICPSIQIALPDMRDELLNKAILFALLRQEKEVMKEISSYHFSDRFVVGKSDNPYSLMLGVSGDICFTIDVIQGSGKFPGFDL